MVRKPIKISKIAVLFALTTIFLFYSCAPKIYGQTKKKKKKKKCGCELILSNQKNDIYAFC